MCTAIILHKVIPSHPIVVAGNRDEWIARTAIAPHVWSVQGENHPVRIFAGKDQKEGGTWFGVNQYGLVVGVTNRYTGTRDTERASRGQLVLMCLAQNSIDSVLAILDEQEVSRYNPFNLFCLSDEVGVVITHDDHRFQRIPIKGGIHILTNRPPDDPQDPKREWLRSRLDDLPSEPDAIVGPISQVLAAHGEGDTCPPVCVHLPGYGTVSSFLLLLSAQKGQSRYLYAEGSPCQSEFQDITHDLLTVFSKEGRDNA
jgi:hypothetical protein